MPLSKSECEQLFQLRKSIEASVDEGIWPGDESLDRMIILIGKSSDGGQGGAAEEIDSWRLRCQQVRVHKTIMHPACGTLTLMRLQLCAAYCIDPVTVLDEFWEKWGGENG